MAKQPSSKEQTREHILQKAVESFKTLGYARTTTQSIGKNAGVAEITLFRHFGDKETLFKAAVQQIASDVPWEIIEQRLPGSLEDDLAFIAQKILAFFLNQRHAIAMLMFESNHFSEMKEALASNPRGTMVFLNRYFQKHITSGTIKSEKVDILSQMFVSMLFGYALGLDHVKDLLDIENPHSPEALTLEFVQIFLQGIL